MEHRFKNLTQLRLIKNLFMFTKLFNKETLTSISKIKINNINYVN